MTGYYAWKTRPPSARSQQDIDLTQHIHQSFESSGRRYGSPRVYHELLAAGHPVSRKRVARLMKSAGLRARAKRRKVQTTDSNHQDPIAPNVLARQFAPTTIPALNCAWAGDITYIPTAAGFLYLAVVLDLKSRRVIGWSMSTTLEKTIALDALDMALKNRGAGAGASAGGLVFHSDRGSQYASIAFRDKLQTSGIIQSMSRRGDCWDNAVSESFFASLKAEEATKPYSDHNAARCALFGYIETFYNNRRRHSSLGYISPKHYEENLT